MDVAALLEPLNLKNIDSDWVQDVWYREFLENVDLPQEYEMLLANLDINDVLHSFTKATKKWLDETDTELNEDDRTWRALVKNVQHRELTALLFNLLQKGQKNVLNDDYRVSAILAARTYFTMLMIPGSNVYRIFHSQMYIQCLSCFKFTNMLMEQHQYYSESDELNLLNRQLKSLLSDLHILIYNVNLKNGDSSSIEETVCCLVEFIGNTNVDDRFNLDKLVLTRLQAVALQCIEILIKGEEEEEPDEIIITLIFKALLPKFTSLNGTKKSLMLWRASGVTYCGALLLKYGAVAMNGFTCLLQHLCFNSEGMERVDNRNSRVRLVVGLLSLMPIQPYKELLEWIVKLSRNTKPQLRLFAVEVLGTLVSGEDRNLEESVGIAVENSTENDNPPVPVSPTDPTESAVDPVPSTSTDVTNREDSEAVSEENEVEAAVNVPTQHQKVAHKDLLRVVCERCQDASSSVRTKAVAILTASTAPTNQAMKAAINEVFVSEEELLNLAAQKLKDERVTVRRTAMTLVENLLLGNEALLTKENLEPMVALCRDMSMMVRSAAITCITGLATHWSTPAALEAWLAGPLNQVSDPEVKVQDMVIENLRNLLIVPLGRYSVSPSPAEQRPWLLLAAITRGNMRRHLSRALAKMANSSKALSYRLIDILYTHIGTENNLSCWVLLSCVARHIDVADINFVLDYYNELTPEQLFGDVRLVSLIFEVLREWSKFVTEFDSNILRCRLIRSLREGGSLPAAGAQGAISLCVMLTKRHGGDLGWAADLMKEGETKMLDSWRHRDNVLQIQGTALLTVSDLALVSEKRPSQDFVEMLLEIAGTFQGDNYEDMSVSVGACAVAALGKLSIRERSTASIAAPLCARLLSTLSCPLPMKVNAMCVLADLCTRFTSIVEPMLPSVCACLGNPQVGIRRCAAQLVTQLLVGDFLRLRGSLYFHYFPLICDEDETIRDIANYYILNCLVQRNRNILYHNFVECIFYYNKFEGHALYGKFYVTDEERRLFTLEGENKRSTRLAIYELMLTHMSDIQRLNTQVKLCKEAVTVGESGEAGVQVLRDALAALRKAARPPQQKQQSDDMATRVATNIVSEKMKLNVMEVVVPTVLNLHRTLRASSSPLTPDLVAYACDLLRDFKQEIEELFEADVELNEEIKILQSKMVNSGTPGSALQKSNRVNNLPVGLDNDDNNESMMMDIGTDDIIATPLTRKPRVTSSRKSKESRVSKAGIRAKRSLTLNV